MVEFDEFAGVLTDEVRAEFAEAGADTFGIGGKIEWSEGTDFAMTGEASICFHPDDGAVEDGDGFSAGPFVGGFVERKFDAISKDTGDFHAKRLKQDEG
jgi:hypothetical protein